MVIISFILTIFLNDSTVFLLGEIRCWSLLEFKGLDAILARPFISNGGRTSGNFGVLKLRDRSLDSSFHQQAVVILNLYNILKTNQFPGGGVTLVNFFLGTCRCPLKISALCRVFFGQLQTPAILVTFGHMVTTF